MEQSTLKRYHEIHVMLWEEVLKVFSARTSNINDIKYYKENGQLPYKLNMPNIKRKALLRLFVSGKITEEEKDNLSMSSGCAACYIAHQKQESYFGEIGMLEVVCFHCPIVKWRKGVPCDEYYTIEEHIDNLIRYIEKCTSGKEKFNLKAYTKLRKDTIKKIYIVAHLEWRYED